MNDNLEKCWSEYTTSNYKNVPFDADDFIWSSKVICEGNINICRHNYYLPYTKLLGFVACRVTSKSIGIGSTGRSLGDVKTMKYGKRSDISSDVQEKQIIVYKSECI